MPSGVYVRTERHCQIMREVQNRPEVRRRKSDALTRRKISEANKIAMNRPEVRKKLSEAKKKMTEETKRRMSEAKKGNRHPMWKGGVAPYYSENSVIRERLIRERGPYCEDCGRDYSQDLHKLHMHHIDGDRHNNSDDNLKLLGCRCHLGRHRYMKKKRFPVFFQKYYEESFPWRKLPKRVAS